VTLTQGSGRRVEDLKRQLHRLEAAALAEKGQLLARIVTLGQRSADLADVLV
jgi:hypothetical protein